VVAELLPRLDPPRVWVIRMAIRLQTETAASLDPSTLQRSRLASRVVVVAAVVAAAAPVAVATNFKDN